MTSERPTLAATRKERPSFELASELVFRPLAHLVVLALAPLRVSAAGRGRGRRGGRLLGGRASCWAGNLVLAAVLLQVKTVLDNADGQLARALEQVTVLGRYLDSESDLLVNAALFAALGIGHREVVARGDRVRGPHARAERRLRSRAALPARARRAARGPARGDRGRGRPRPGLRRRLRAAGPARRVVRRAAAPRREPRSNGSPTTTAATLMVRRELRLLDPVRWCSASASRPAGRSSTSGSSSPAALSLVPLELRRERLARA